MGMVWVSYPPSMGSFKVDEAPVVDLIIDLLYMQEPGSSVSQSLPIFRLRTRTIQGKYVLTTPCSRQTLLRCTKAPPVTRTSSTQCWTQSTTLHAWEGRRVPRSGGVWEWAAYQWRFRGLQLELGPAHERLVTIRASDAPGSSVLEEII